MASYKDKIEREFKSNNSKATWDGMKSMAGLKKKSPEIVVNEDPIMYVNKLNDFYARFDVHDFEDAKNDLMSEILKEPIDKEVFSVSEEDVRGVFHSMNVRKASGPDGLKCWIFKHCASQLSAIYSYMFNLSLRSHTLRSIWKTAEIIPIPKKQKINELNDLRPVALTSIVTKALETIIVKEIKKRLTPVQDPMQFAYREKRSVDDAILVFWDNIYQHLDTPRNYCRVLFIDFSSAFNTIQPHLML